MIPILLHMLFRTCLIVNEPFSISELQQAPEFDTDIKVSNSVIPGASIRAAVDSELASTPFIDLHTHLFMPSLGPIGLWGIDELVTYHYLEAELFRSNPITP